MRVCSWPGRFRIMQRTLHVSGLRTPFTVAFARLDLVYLDEPRNIVLFSPATGAALSVGSMLKPNLFSMLYQHAGDPSMLMPSQAGQPSVLYTPYHTMKGPTGPWIGIHSGTYGAMGLWCKLRSPPPLPYALRRLVCSRSQDRQTYGPLEQLTASPITPSRASSTSRPPVRTMGRRCF